MKILEIAYDKGVFEYQLMISVTGFYNLFQFVRTSALSILKKLLAKIMLIKPE